MLLMTVIFIKMNWFVNEEYKLKLNSVVLPMVMCGYVHCMQIRLNVSNTVYQNNKEEAYYIRSFESLALLRLFLRLKQGGEWRWAEKNYDIMEFVPTDSVYSKYRYG